MKKNVLKILSALLNMLLVLSVLILSGVVISTSQNKVPSVFGYSLFRIISPSMEPMYNVGDYILVKKVTPSDLKPGDVISFYSKDPSILGMPNTHQIVRIEDSGEFITQGLANNKEDDYPVPAQNVIGVVKKKITLLSFISPLLSNPFLLIMLLIIPIVILGVVQLVVLKKDSEKNNLKLR